MAYRNHSHRILRNNLSNVNIIDTSLLSDDLFNSNINDDFKSNSDYLNEFQSLIYNPKKYHLFILIICSLCFGTTNLIIYNMSYATFRPEEYKCTNYLGQVMHYNTRNKTDSIELCNTSKQNWDCQPEGEYIINMITRRGMICESEIQDYSATFGSTYYIAMVIGCIFLGYFMDNYGRKFCMLIGGSVLIAAFSILIFDTGSSSWDYVASFLLGSFGEFFYMTSYVLASELCGVDGNKTVSITLISFDSLGAVFGTIFVYYFNNIFYWFILCFIRFLIVYIIVIVYIPESPHWQLNNNKVDLCISTCTYITEFNEITHLSEQLKQLEIYLKKSPVEKKNKSVMMQMESKSFQEARMQIDYQMGLNVILTAIMWAVSVLLLFYIFFYAKYFKTNIFLTMLTLGMGQFISNYVNWRVMKYIDVRSALYLYLAIFSLGVGLLELSNQDGWLLYVSVLLLMMMANVINCNVWLVTDLLYKEEVKGKVFSVCNMVGRFGGILAPIFTEYLSNPAYMMITAAIVFAACLSLIRSMR